MLYIYIKREIERERQNNDNDNEEGMRPLYHTPPQLSLFLTHTQVYTRPRLLLTCLYASGFIQSDITSTCCCCCLLPRLLPCLLERCFLRSKKALQGSRYYWESCRRTRGTRAGASLGRVKSRRHEMGSRPSANCRYRCRLFPN